MNWPLLLTVAALSYIIGWNCQPKSLYRRKFNKLCRKQKRPQLN